MAVQGTTDKSLSNFLKFDEPASAKNLAETAEKELNETPELKKKSLKRLKELIRENKVACITRDDFLLKFLRYKKFDIQRSFQALRNYAQHRVNCHEMLLHFSPEKIRELLNLNFTGVLPYRDSKERRICYFRAGIWNSDICSQEEMLTLLFLLCDYGIQDPSMQILGIEIICDANTFSIQKDILSIRNMKRLIKYSWESCPARYPVIHIINEAPVVHYAFNLLKPVIPKKFMERLLFHGETRHSFFEHIARSIAPKEFGGDLDFLNSDHLLKLIDEYLRKIKDEQQYFIKLQT